MSKPHLEQLLQRELQTVNDLIDTKIVRGLNYAREARRHKFITARLSQIRRHSRPSFFRLFAHHAARV